MDEFVDATSDLERPDRLRERLSEDGCLFFRGLFSPEQVFAVRDRELRVLEQIGWLEEGTAADEARPGSRLISEGDEVFFEGYTLLQAMEDFHALAHAPSITTLMGRLFGADPLVHPRKIGRIAFPDNPRGTTPPHQDFRYIQGSTDVFTCWLPFGDCPSALGGLRVLRGSHRRGLLPATWDSERSAGLVVDVDENDPGWATVDYACGDCIVFHSLTVHGATPNHAGEIRLSADFRYQSATDPLVADSMKPHYFPKVPDWPQLVEGWSSLDAIAATGTPVFNDFGPPLDLPAPGRSRFFEFAGQAS